MVEQSQHLAAEVEAVKEAYAELNRNDIEGFAQILDPGVVRIEPEGFPTAGTYRGLEAVKEHIAQGRSTWAEGSCEPTGFFTAGDKVLVSLHVHVRLKDQTDWIDGCMADVFTFRNGKAIEFRSFANEPDALEYVRIR